MAKFTLMILKRWILTATLLISSGSTFAVEGDWGYAQNLYLKLNLTEKWSFLHRSQFALRDDMSDLFFGFADAGLGYKFHPAWRIDGVYRRAWIEPGDTWLIEDRPLVNLTWFGKIKEARLMNRSRVEFRLYRWDKEDDIRFRNESRVELPWGLWGIKPYFEEEFFWGYNRGDFEMNWLTGGLAYKAGKKVKLKLGYRWILIRNFQDEWENRNQLVSGINLYF